MYEAGGLTGLQSGSRERQTPYSADFLLITQPRIPDHEWYQSHSGWVLNIPGKNLTGRGVSPGDSKSSQVDTKDDHRYIPLMPTCRRVMGSKY